MRTIIAGSRSVADYQVVLAAIRDCPWAITCVISGAARGVDRLGEQWARENDVPCERFPADWIRYGRSAGYRRNREMAEVADALLAIWDGESPGTSHMIDIATSKALRIHVFQTTDEDRPDLESEQP